MAEAFFIRALTLFAFALAPTPRPVLGVGPVRSLQTTLRSVGSPPWVTVRQRTFNDATWPGASCLTDSCVATAGLTCDDVINQCRCLDAANFDHVSVQGYSIRLQWHSSPDRSRGHGQVGRCLAQPGTLCATEPVSFTDLGSGDSVLVPVDCEIENGYICAPLEELAGGAMKAGYCKKMNSGSRSSASRAEGAGARAGAWILVILASKTLVALTS